MRIRRQRDGKLNNAGMSLVEIVVAMFILSAVTVTILSILVYSIRLNSRSRTRQQSTAAAQTVMENFKAYSVEEICEQFANNTFIANEAGEEGGHPDMQIVPVGDDKYFQLRGVQYQNEKYDVEIKLSTHTMDMDSLIFENFTFESTALYVGNIRMDVDALDGIAEQVAKLWTVHENELSPSLPSVSHSGSEVDLSQIDIKDRKLIFEVAKDGGEYIVTVSCEYTYEVYGGKYSYTSSRTGNEEDCLISGDYFYKYDRWDATEVIDEGKKAVIFRQPTKPENLVIYYYPAYDANWALNIENDNMVIKNTLDKVGNVRPRIKCYIYKQRNMAVSNNRISTAEVNYLLNLDLGDQSEVSEEMNDQVYIYDDNLSTVLCGDSSSVARDYSGIKNRLHGVGYMANNPSATPSPKEKDQTMESKSVMYNVIVAVYRNGELPETPSSDPDGSYPSDLYPSTLSVLESTIIEKK